MPVSRMPARLDVLQSASGVFLALFMWLHMFFVASILLGKDVFWHVARFFEGYHLLGEPYPILVSGVALFIFVVFIAHAALAMRKFPSDYRQYRAFREHAAGMKHTDTTLWFVQVYTGFAMFFLGSVHLYTMLTRPESIGPYGSADRVVTDWFWPLYLLLLFATVLSTLLVGATAWYYIPPGEIAANPLRALEAWLEGRDPAATRRNMKRAKWLITVFFLTLGLLSLAAYIKIGIDHRDDYGEHYVPAGVKEPLEPRQ